MACGPGPAPSLRQLWAEIQAAFSGRVSYLGICGDDAHAARKSAHNVGLALDVGVGGDHDLGWHIANRFLADGRAWNAIHNRRGRRADHRGGSGFSASGHESHVHLEIHEAARNDTSPWGFAAGAAPAPGPTPATPALDDYHALGRGAIIKQGSRGEAVRHVQGLLHHFGIDAGPADGIFGPKTTAAVKEFQRRAGIGTDGIVGAQTYTQLEDCYYSRGKFAPAAVPPFPGTVRRGDRGEAVRQVQQRLADRGWHIDVDGIFGPQTERVVTQFQAEKGLVVDGIAGPQTWHALWTAPVT